MLARHSAPEWSASITTEHAKLQGQDREYCKRLYLDMAKTLKYYGSSVFPVQVSSCRRPMTTRAQPC
jgi:hypothetical protein